MLNCVTYLEIQQKSERVKNRNLNLFFDFVNEFESTDSWEDFTNQCKVTLPKNITYTDLKTGAPHDIDNIGGFTVNPTFIKGDEVLLKAGYTYYKDGCKVEDISVIFQGYITNVTSKKPFTIECEDHMFILKQTPAMGKNGKTYFSAKDYTVETMMQELMRGTNLTVNTKTSTTIGDYIISENMTVMQVLEDLRKTCYLESFFREKELQIGFLVYDEEIALKNEAKQKKVFIFQDNIIEDNLDYKKKDDIVLSAIATSINTVKSNKQTKDGKDKTKDERLEVLVYSDNGTLKGVKKEKGKAFPENKEGERRTFNFQDITDANVLIERAKEKLKKYYYTGFKGTFITFGIPFCQQGDNCYIIDKILPERNGYYKIKQVKYTGGIGGLRQEITLDYKIEISKIEIDKIIDSYNAYR